MIRTRADGSRADFHDARRGMDIRYGLNGSRHVVAERSDHSRIFAERGGRGYVQHPYDYPGAGVCSSHVLRTTATSLFGSTSLSLSRREPSRFTSPCTYYPVGFYGWVDTPWGESIHYIVGLAGYAVVSRLRRSTSLPYPVY